MRTSLWNQIKFTLAMLIVLSFILASCGGGSSSSGTSAPDTVTLTVNGVAATYSDETQNVAITAYANTAGGTTVFLGAPSQTLTLSLNSAPPASFPATMTGSLSYIVGGIAYQNSNVSVTVTRLDGSLGGRVEGSFPAVALNPTNASSAVDINVSGSFSATRIN